MAVRSANHGPPYSVPSSTNDPGFRKLHRVLVALREVLVAQCFAEGGVLLIEVAAHHQDAAEVADDDREQEDAGGNLEPQPMLGSIEAAIDVDDRVHVRMLTNQRLGESSRVTSSS